MGFEPACVNACSSHCIYFGDIAQIIERIGKQRLLAWCKGVSVWSGSIIQSYLSGMREQRKVVTSLFVFQLFAKQVLSLRSSKVERYSLEFGPS